MSEIKEENVTDTHEYVIIDDENYKTESVTTGVDSIGFSIADMEIADAVKKFKTVTELSISGEDLKPYGVYSNLSFASATVDADGVVTVVFHIATQEEIRIKNLEATQTEQDVAISELMFGGENDEQNN